MKQPIKIKVEKNKIYSWCSCEFSKKQPFCDGSHRDNDTNLRSVKYKADANKEVYFCNCKLTKTPPFCDGSHKN